MSRRKFDRYMVVAGAGRHVKFARLTDSERCAHFLGVLSIAAQAPIRGCLLVGDQEADAVEVAHEARVSTKIAESALVKLKAIGVLERDDEMGCWCVHDWGDVNPPPKTDGTNAERQARYRERLAARNAEHNAVTNAVTNGAITDDLSRAGDRVRPVPEGVEEEVETPQAPQGVGVGFDDENVVADIRQQAADIRELFEYWQQECQHPDAKLTGERRRKTQARLRDGYTVQQIRQGIDGARDFPFINPEGKRFDDLELICRNGSKLEDFMGRTSNTPEPRGPGFGDRMNAKNLA